MSITEVDRAERMAAMVAEYRERKAEQRLETLRRTEVRTFKYEGVKPRYKRKGN